MLELDKIFVAKNKRALLEEITMQLAKARELIDMVSVNSEALAGGFVGIAATVGAIDGFFREYMLLRRGEIPTQHLIGFQVFDEPEEEEESVDDDSESPVEKKSSKKARATK